ncbi:MAG: sodium/solute symporter [Bacteroidota bacterium]
MPCHSNRTTPGKLLNLFWGSLLLFVVGCPLQSNSQSFTQEKLAWDQLPELPPAPEQTHQPGLAGAFSGVHNDALIIAGGANFPDAPPWEGGAKKWWDHIYVLEKTEEGGHQWLTNDQYRLPIPLAYGVAVSTEEGVLCMGGNNENAVSARVFLLQWDAETKQIEVTEKPSLPFPLAMMAGARVGQTIYVCGGQTSNEGQATKTFLSLDLRSYTWHDLPSWPGSPRVLPVAAAQSNGATNCFYLFSGRNVVPDTDTQILADAYRYHPIDQQWKKLKDIRPQNQPVSVMAATAVASGANHILVFGGAEGYLFTKLEALDNAVTQALDSAEATALLTQQREILTNHPGFSRNVLAYHTLTDTWTQLDEFPDDSPVTTHAIRWGNDIVIPSGEVRPGIRTPTIWKINTVVATAFGWLNYAVMGGFLILLVGMGIYFSKRESSTDDYFKAGGRIPWWAAGLSIFGTQLSAITFMALPAKTFATDWSYFMLNMTVVMVAPLIVYGFLPFYRRLNITTAYEYLEKRFNLTTRLAGSLMFIIFQLGRIGVVLFLPSIALSVVTGFDVRACILVMGGLSIFYTVLGGIEAVIWTDVIQVIVLLGGALACLALMSFQVEGGLEGMIAIAASEQKFNMLDFSFTISSPSFWVVVLGGLGANLISYGSDQTVVQRYLTTKSEKSAAQSIWTGALLTLPSTVLFFGIGTALFVFYRTYPDLMNVVSLENADAIFPYYIVTQLPAGVAGILIAGVFAAAMSSLDSSMNSIAAVVTHDGFRRFNPGISDTAYLRVAKWTTALVGTIGTGFALLMAGWEIKSLWDQFNTFIGLFAGGLGGLFLLGMFTRKANGIGAVVGLLASGVVQYMVKEYTNVHLLLYTLTGITSCITVGYVVSLLFPGSNEEVKQLTINNLNSRSRVVHTKPEI